MIRRTTAVFLSFFVLVGSTPSFSGDDLVHKRTFYIWAGGAHFKSQNEIVKYIIDGMNASGEYTSSDKTAFDDYFIVDIDGFSFPFRENDEKILKGEAKFYVNTVDDGKILFDRIRIKCRTDDPKSCSDEIVKKSSDVFSQYDGECIQYCVNNFVSFVDILSDSKKYEGKKIVISGFLSGRNSPETALYLTQEHANGRDDASAIVIRFSCGGDFENLLDEGEGKWVRLSGTFTAEDYAPQGLYRGTLTVADCTLRE